MKFKIFSYKEVNSTNNVAIRLIKNKNINNGFVYSLKQKKGRGTYGRKWISKKGNLFASIFFTLKKNYPSVNQFTLINTLLNIDVIKKYCGKNKIFYKPPNDIYVNKRKISGILQEVITNNKKLYLIVGIGINLIANPKIKNYPSTNIFAETKKKPKLKNLVHDIKNKYEFFFKNINSFNYSKLVNESKKNILIN